MRTFLMCTAIVCMSAMTFADGTIAPISGYQYLNYNEATGLITPGADLKSHPKILWSVTDTQGNGFYYPEEYCVMDWGDISKMVPIGKFGFSTFTNSQIADGNITIFLGIYGSENGHNSTGRQLLAMYELENVPGSSHDPFEYWGWFWQLEPTFPLYLEGDDLDGDGLLDFGYSLGFNLATPNSLAGPLIAGPTFPNEPQYSTGIEDAYDLFTDHEPGGYLGTYDFGGDPFAQFYFEMISPKCSNDPMACHADLNGNCEIDLGDLAQLLGHYGMTSGAVWEDGDIEPYPDGDGGVNIVDLASMLADWGPCGD